MAKGSDLIPRPGVRPAEMPSRPWFSSGPTAKPPGWALERLPTALLGRGIRAPEVVERFAHALELTRQVLEVPDSHALVFTPGSDTGAVEAAMWSLLGPRPVQVLAFENFGRVWADDARAHLKIEPEVIEAPYGALPDLACVRHDTDVVFPWNGTTSGVRIPDAAFLAEGREGLAICDATSAAFAMELPWERLDVVTFSFQKALGGEAGIGMAALSQRAIARLDSHRPPWPVPKVLRLHGPGGGFERALAAGQMINTYSVMTIEDWILALEWAQSIGGLGALIARSHESFAALEAHVEGCPHLEFLARERAWRSHTSVCLKLAGETLCALDEGGQREVVARIKTLLEREGAGFDLEGHRNAPPGLRVWCGPTVEPADVRALLPWLDWALAQVIAERQP
jgi:phosphoserine aminotransferase